MGVRRSFPGGKVDFLLILFMLLTLQSKWTLTKRFTLSTPQRKFRMKAPTPLASFFKSYSNGSEYEFATKEYFLS